MIINKIVGALRETYGVISKYLFTLYVAVTLEAVNFVLILLCALLAILQVYSASPILAALVVVIFAVLFSVAVIAAAVYFPPLQAVFETVPLNSSQLLWCMALAFAAPVLQCITGGRSKRSVG